MIGDIRDFFYLMFVIMGSATLCIGAIVLILVLALGPFAIVSWGLVEAFKLLAGAL